MLLPGSRRTAPTMQVQAEDAANEAKDTKHKGSNFANRLRASRPRQSGQNRDDHNPAMEVSDATSLVMHNRNGRSRAVTPTRTPSVATPLNTELAVHTDGDVETLGLVDHSAAVDEAATPRSPPRDLFALIDKEEKAPSGLYKLYIFLFRKFAFDPYGQFRKAWDFILLMLVFFSSCWEPYKASYIPDPEAKIEWWEWIIDGLFYCDIIINFMTGWDRGYEIVWDRPAIHRNYIRTWFFLDLISTVEWDQVVKYFDPSNHNAQLCRLIKVLRLARASRLLNRLTMSWTIHTGYVEAMKFFAYVMIVAHLLACLFFLMPSLLLDCNMVHPDRADLAFFDSVTNTTGCVYEDVDGTVSWRSVYGLEALGQDRHFSQYVSSMYWSLTTMTTIGYGDRGPQAEAEVIFTIFAELIGLTFFALLMQQISYLNDVMGMSENENKEEKNKIVMFMKYNSLEPHLIEEVVKFLNFKSQSHSGHTLRSQNPDFKSLSDKLKIKIQVVLFRPALEKVRFFGHSKADIEEATEIRERFDKIDQDGGGTLDEDEIGQLLAGLTANDESTSPLTDEDRREYFAEMLGVDGGTNPVMEDEEEPAVTFEQFQAWWHRKKYFCEKMPKCADSFLDHLAVELSNNMKPYGRKEVIVDSGEYGQKMYFVLHGTVTVKRHEVHADFIDPYADIVTAIIDAERRKAICAQERREELTKLEASELEQVARKTLSGGIERQLQVAKNHAAILRKTRQRCDTDALRARLQKQTQAELGLRWQHAMGNEREEILDSAEVLIAKLIKLEETQKVISSHDEEPVFGMMAAISDDEVFNKVGIRTQYWTVDSCEFCDITYIERAHLNWALDNLWPPSEEDAGGYMSVGGRVAMERLAWIEQGLSKKKDIELMLDSLTPTAASNRWGDISKMLQNGPMAKRGPRKGPDDPVTAMIASLESKQQELRDELSSLRVHLDTRLNKLEEMLMPR